MDKKQIIKELQEIILTCETMEDLIKKSPYKIETKGLNHFFYIDNSLFSLFDIGYFIPERKQHDQEFINPVQNLIDCIVYASEDDPDSFTYEEVERLLIDSYIELKMNFINYFYDQNILEKAKQELKNFMGGTIYILKDHNKEQFENSEEYQIIDLFDIPIARKMRSGDYGAYNLIS